MFVKEEMVGKVKTMTITAFLPDIGKYAEKRFDVESCNKSMNGNLMCNHFVFYGKLVEFNQKWKELFVDIGVGIIGVSVHQFQSEGLKIGDFMRVSARRIDLHGVYDE